MSIDWIGRSQELSLRVRDFVDGAWRSKDEERVIRKYSPRDGSLLCNFGAGSVADVEHAVASARRAFQDGRWSKLSIGRRKEVLHRLASLVEAHGDEFALLECLDVGKPISDALRIDVPMAASAIRYSAEALDKCYGKVYAVDQASLSYQLQRARGVVAAIVGWNFPLVLAAGKAGPVLAAGNSLVLKPSEVTSFSASRLAQLAIEAGVPEGVFNVVHGGPEIGSYLSHHRDVDLVTFTGSSNTGKRILAAAGESNMKRAILECGGKAPNIVFEDCPDIDAVADAIVARAFWNQGEVCTASSRLLVQGSIKEELLRRVIQRTSELRPADPLVAETNFGALVTEQHMSKVLEYVECGEREGARLVHQSAGPAPFEHGFYVSPVIFDGVLRQHRIAKEEIFGPVLSVMTFRDEEEAISISNSTLYGLSAILWTTDLGRAHRMSHSIDAGWIVINATAHPKGGPVGGTLSIGGHKESGVGTLGGLDGLQAYMSTTAVQLFV